MTVSELVSISGDYASQASGNYVEVGALASIRIFDEPVFGFGSPDDLMFKKFTSREVVSEKFLIPNQWLESAKTVVSFFLPYSQAVRESNTKNFSWPSDLWLYARHEGQMFIREFAEFLCGIFKERSAKSVIPAADARYATGDANNRFASNWSERHVAYACGLGTFGLSKGLITQKGVCGRFGSIVTELDFPVSTRNYTGVYDYCNKCSDCVKNCPVSAISVKEGKNDLLCSDFLDLTREKHNPRYGCGKCQVGVSCENGISEGL